MGDLSTIEEYNRGTLLVGCLENPLSPQNQVHLHELNLFCEIPWASWEDVGDLITIYDAENIVGTTITFWKAKFLWWATQVCDMFVKSLGVIGTKTYRSEVDLCNSLTNSSAGLLLK